MLPSSSFKELPTVPEGHALTSHVVALHLLNQRRRERVFPERGSLKVRSPQRRPNVSNRLKDRRHTINNIPKEVRFDEISLGSTKELSGCNNGSSSANGVAANGYNYGRRRSSLQVLLVCGACW